MSDPTTPPPSPSPAPSAPSEPSGPKAPIAIIRGTATTSSWLENDLAQRKHNRQVAQDQADEEVAEHHRAKGSADTASMLHTADMGRPATNPVCVIEVVMAGGRKHQFIQGDLTLVEVDNEPGLQLNLICPACVARGIPQGDAQIRIHEKHKRMSLDMSTKGELWVDPDTGDTHLLAGTVEVDEKCRCPMPGCGFAFRVSPRGPQRGVSRLMKE